MLDLPSNHCMQSLYTNMVANQTSASTAGMQALLTARLTAATGLKHKGLDKNAALIMPRRRDNTDRDTGLCYFHVKPSSVGAK